MNIIVPRSQNSPVQHDSCMSCEEITVALFVIAAIGGVLTAASGTSAFGLGQHWWTVGLQLDPSLALGMMVSGGAFTLTSVAILSAKSCWYPTEQEEPIEPPPEKPITPMTCANEGMSKSLSRWATNGPPGEKENRLTCGRKILTCWQSQTIETLSLKDLALTSLPREIFGLTWLKTLDLSGNRLSSFPTELFDLKNLTQLNLENNRLTSLPENFCTMKCSFSLKGNPFSLSILQALNTPIPKHPGQKIDCDPLPRKIEAMTFSYMLGAITGSEEPIILCKELDVELVRDWLFYLLWDGAGTRPTFAKMIYQTIKKANENPTFRTIFLSQCNSLNDSKDFIERVGKAVLSVFRTHIKYSIQNSTNLVEIASLCLHGLYALSIIEIKALGRIQTRTKTGKINKAAFFSDPIDIFLTYVSQLKKTILLPIDDEDCLSYKCGAVTPENLKSTKDQLIEVLTTPEKYYDALSKIVDWKIMLQKLRGCTFTASQPARPNTPQKSIPPPPPDILNTTKQVLQELEYAPPIYRLNAAPDWASIESTYTRLKEEANIFRPPVPNDSDRALEADILSTLKMNSSLSQTQDLPEHNRELSANEKKQRYDHCFQNTALANSHRIKLFVFSDGTQKIECRDATPHKQEIVPVFIDIFYCSKTYDQYLEGLAQYERESQGYDASGDKELFGLKMGDSAVAYLSKTKKEYDLFETSPTAAGKHRIALAMEEAYQAKESKASMIQYSTDDEPMIDLQGRKALDVLKSHTCNLGPQYCLAYILARQLCDRKSKNPHAFVLKCFQNQLKENSHEFVSTIAGLGVALAD